MYMRRYRKANAVRLRLYDRLYKSRASAIKRNAKLQAIAQQTKHKCLVCVQTENDKPTVHDKCGTLHQALEVIGFDRTTTRFWERYSSDLDGVLKDIHGAYRKAIKQWHTDRGGCHERTVLINRAWARVRHLFARRGVTLE